MNLPSKKVMSIEVLIAPSAVITRHGELGLNCQTLNLGLRVILPSGVVVVIRSLVVNLTW